MLKNDQVDVLKASYKQRPENVFKTLIIFCSVKPINYKI
jgi:hypothetical protein